MVAAHRCWLPWGKGSAHNRLSDRSVPATSCNDCTHLSPWLVPGGLGSVSQKRGQADGGQRAQGLLEQPHKILLELEAENTKSKVESHLCSGIKPLHKAGPTQPGRVLTSVSQSTSRLLDASDSPASDSDRQNY